MSTDPNYESKRVKARIEQVVRVQEDKHSKKWKKLVDIYAGDFYKGQSTVDRVAVNLGFAVINVIVPALTHQRPRITVNPLDPESGNASHIIERVLNQEWKKLDVQNEVAEAVKDGLIVGTGWVKIGWRRVERDKRRSEKDIHSEKAVLKAQKDEYANTHPELKDDLPSDADTFVSVPTTERALMRDELFVERVAPETVFVDPEATDHKDMKFVFQRIVKPVEAVAANSKYRKSVRDKLKADTYSSDTVGRHEYDDLPSELREDMKRCTLFEYWDIEDETFTVYAESCDEPLFGPVPWSDVNGGPQSKRGFLPFYAFRNYPIPGRFFGTSDLEQIKPLLEELNKTRSQMVNQRSQYSRKAIYKENAFHPDDLAALRSTKDGVMVPVRGNQPLAEAVQLLQPPQLDAQLYQMNDTIKSDIGEITAISEYQRGQLPDIRRTATEASIIESSSSVRSQAKLAQVEWLMARIAEGMIALMQRFYTEERVVRSVGDSGSEIWFTFDGDLLDGEFHIEIEAGSTQPQNDAVRKSEARELFQLMMGNPAINQQELAKYVLDAYRIPNTDKLIVPAPTGPDGQPLPPGMPPEMAMMGQMMGGDPAAGGDPNAAPAVDPNAPVDPADAGQAELDALMAQLAGQVGPSAAPAIGPQ